MNNFIYENKTKVYFGKGGVKENTDFRAIANSANITAGCRKKLSRDEIYEILKEYI